MVSRLYPICRMRAAVAKSFPLTAMNGSLRSALALLCIAPVALAAELPDALVTASEGANSLTPAAALSPPSSAPKGAIPPEVVDTAADSEAEAARVRYVPIDGWSDVHAGCRILTTFSSSSQGCAVGWRSGDVAYFHISGGFFATPAFERYMRYRPESSRSSSSASAATAPVTVIDPEQSDVYYVDLGPGVAMWPLRQLQVHFEIGGMAGLIHNATSLATPTYSNDQFVVGAFGGAGLSYRVPSRPWAIGFDYRAQIIPYGGFGSAEPVMETGVQVGHQLFGLAHSFGLSAIYRIEDDGSN